MSLSGSVGIGHGCIGIPPYVKQSGRWGLHSVPHQHLPQKNAELAASTLTPQKNFLKKIH